MSDPPKGLIQEILSDAGRQAERITGKARREAERIVSRSTREAEQVRRGILAEAEQRADKAGRAARGVMAQQVRAVMREAREQVLEQVLEAGVRKAQELVHTDEYGRCLCALALAAMKEMAGDRFTLILNAPDIQKWGARLQDELQALAPARSGQQVEIEISGEAANLTAGVRVVGSNGRELCDQTFQARMRRLRPELRQQVAAILFGESPSDAGHTPQASDDSATPGRDKAKDVENP